MASETVDITADREKAQKTSKELGEAVGKAIADPIKRQLDEALKPIQRMGRLQAQANADNDRRDARKNQDKEAQRRRDEQHTQKMGRLQAQANLENDRRDKQRQREGDTAERKAASMERQARTAAGRDYLAGLQGIGATPAGWQGNRAQYISYARGQQRQQARARDAQAAGSRNLGAGIEAAARYMIADRARRQERRFYAATGAVTAGAFGLTSMLQSEGAASYNAFHGLRGQLGEAVGPLTQEALMANNAATEDVGERFNVSRARRGALQQMLARHVGIGGKGDVAAGLRNIINIGKGDLGIGSEEAAGFAGRLKEFTGSKGAAIWQDFDKAMQSAQKAGFGSGRFGRSLDGFLKSAAVLSGQRGGDVSAAQIAGLATAYTGPRYGFSREHAFNIGAEVRSGFAATGDTPLTLALFGAQRDGASAAYVRSQLGGPAADKMAIANARRVFRSPVTAARRLMEAIPGLKEKFGRSYRLLYGGKAMAGEAGGTTSGDYGAAIGNVDDEYKQSRQYELEHGRIDNIKPYVGRIEGFLSTKRKGLSGLADMLLGQDYLNYRRPGAPPPNMTPQQRQAWIQKLERRMGDAARSARTAANVAENPDVDAITRGKAAASANRAGSDYAAMKQQKQEQENTLKLQLQQKQLDETKETNRLLREKKKTRAHP